MGLFPTPGVARETPTLLCPLEGVNPEIEISSFKGRQRMGISSPFAWRRKQAQFPKRCDF
jgi:hypothetical protein